MKTPNKTYHASSPRILKVFTLFTKIRKSICTKRYVNRKTLDKAAQAARLAVSELEHPKKLIDQLQLAIITLEQIEVKFYTLEKILSKKLLEIDVYNDIFNGLRPRKFDERQGIAERFSPVIKKLRKEKLRKHQNKQIAYALSAASTLEQKQLKRFIEKRAAQAVHKLASKHDHQTNKLRQDYRRAISYSINFASTADYNLADRINSTHWKKIQDAKGNLILRAKKAYNTLEDAQNAAISYAYCRLEDPENLSAYLCPHCGKYHFGHTPASQLSQAI